jgi:hypothetical protein
MRHWKKNVISRYVIEIKGIKTAPMPCKVKQVNAGFQMATSDQMLQYHNCFNLIDEGPAMEGWQAWRERF